MANTNQESVVDSLSLVTDRLRLLATRRTEMWWDIGQILDEVATRMLSQNLGYRDYTAYAREVLGIDAAEARRLRRVAHHFSREVALRFGTERLDLLLSYMDASPDTHWAMDPLRVELCCSSDAAGTRIAFSEASADDVRRAVRSAQRRLASTDAHFPPDVASLRDRLSRAVAALAHDAPRVKVHRDVGRPEEYALAVVGLDPENMVGVGQVLVEIGKNLARAAKARSKARATKKPAKTATKKPAKTPAKKAPSSRATKAAKTTSSPPHGKKRSSRAAAPKATKRR